MSSARSARNVGQHRRPLPGRGVTSKPYAFVARPWELRKTGRSMCSTRSAATSASTRAAPRYCAYCRASTRTVNEEWISDKTRFAHDGLIRRRLDRPYIRRGGRLVEAEWREALDLVADRLKLVPGERIAAIAGDLCDAEAMYALKELLDGRGCAEPRLPPGCEIGGANIDGRAAPATCSTRRLPASSAPMRAS